MASASKPALVYAMAPSMLLQAHAAMDYEAVRPAQGGPSLLHSCLTWLAYSGLGGSGPFRGRMSQLTLMHLADVWLQIHTFILSMQTGNGSDLLTFDAFSPMPSAPSKGLHIVQLELGETLDIVMQSNPANAFGGDYRYVPAPTLLTNFPFELFLAYSSVARHGALQFARL